MPTEFVVREVTSRKDRKRFLEFPYRHYRDNPAWVPPLRMETAKAVNPKKNAFFEHGDMQLFIAESNDGKMLGRIASIVNGMHLKKYDDGNGFFGFFECVEEYDVAKALLDAAADWLKGKGMTGVRGPANPSLNDICGLLVEGFEHSPSIMMPYNPAYYVDFLMRYGFEEAMIMWAYFIHYKYLTIDKLYRGVQLLHRKYPGLKLRNVDMKHFDRDAAIIMDVYNDAWSNNWGHVPLTENEFAQLAKDLKQIIDPSIVFILEEEGEPIGFSVSLPNINQALKHVKNGRLLPTGLFKLLLRGKFGGINECRTLLMGIRKSHQKRGLDAILNVAIMEEGPANGYPASEMSWVLDSNPRLKNGLLKAGGTPEKRYAMLEKTL